jgi:hypothetical protein
MASKKKIATRVTKPLKSRVRPVKLSASYREVARQLNRSVNHVFQVANGHRRSAELERRLAPFIISQ